MKIKQLLILSLLITLIPQADAQISDELQKQQEDARLYLEMIDILKEAPIEDQITGWEKFIREHPNNYFLEEITANLENIKARQAIQEKRREEEDSRRYFKTVEKAGGLTLDQRIRLWERFLRDNPESLFANEARTTLNRLREQRGIVAGKVAPRKPPSKPAPVKKPPPAKEFDLNPDQTEYLDPEKAFFLAAVPGLIVPGIGHFYTKQYAMGAFIAALRVGGLLILGVGAFREANTFIVPGALLAASSYAIDVVVAPIEARNYNYRQNPLPPLDENQVPQSLQQPNVPPTETLSSLNPRFQVNLINISF